MSKKILSLIGAAFVLLLAYIGIAWYCGKSYEAKSQQDVQKINGLIAQAMNQNNMPGLDLRITQTDFKRGIFSSEARYQLFAAGSEQGVPFVAHIQHGPFVGLHPARYLATYELENTPQTNMIFKLTEGKSPLTIVTREGFTNSINMKITMPPINFAEGEMRSVFSGLVIDADTDRDVSFLKGDLRMDNLSMHLGLNKFDLSNLRGDFDLKSNGSYLVGTSESTIDSFAYGDFPGVAVNKIKMTSASKDVGKLNHSDMLLNVGNISVGKQDFGTLQWAVKLDNFDMFTYQKLVTDIQNMRSGDADLEQSLENNLRAILVAKPVLTMNPVEWKTPVGKSTASLVVTFKAPAPDQKITKITDFVWQDWVEKGEFKTNLSKEMMIDVGAKTMQISGMDAETAKSQAQSMLVGWMQQGIDEGMVKDSGTAYTSDIRFENGLFNVNGKSMTPAEFQQIGKSSENIPAETADSVVDESGAVSNDGTSPAPDAVQ